MVKPDSGKLVQLLRENGVVVFVYLLATWFTNAHFQADTTFYLDSIVAFEHHHYYEFWEFGHVLWRPLGWLLMRGTLPLTRPFAGGDLRISALIVLLALNWLAGLAVVLSLAAILRRFCDRPWAINVAVIGLMLSHGFLNYAQTGAPYIVSAAFLTVSLYLLLRHDKGREVPAKDALIAGVLIGLMICFWFPFCLAVPAVLGAPLLFTTPNRAKIRSLILCAMVGGLLVCIVYAVVAVGALGIHSVGGFRDWMHQTTGRTVQDKGLARAVFGFARSFIFMGNDGMVFKRFLVHDPFNKVSALDLLRLSVWKLLLFYLFLGAVLFNLLRSIEAKRVLGLFALNALPVVGLAVYWQGGD